MANIIFGSYLGVICFRPEIQFFFVKHNNQILTQNHEQGTHSAQMGTVDWPKIPKMPLHFSALKIGIFEKSSVWVSVRAGIHKKIIWKLAGSSGQTGVKLSKIYKMSFIAQPVGLKYFSVLFFWNFDYVVPPIFCRLLITND